MDRIVEEAGCGLVVNYGDVYELESALTKLALHPELRVQLGNASRFAYETTYSWDRMRERLLDLYASL
jgi:glycosyltransferase involved in cell wall biosynthesis